MNTDITSKVNDIQTMRDNKKPGMYVYNLTAALPIFFSESANSLYTLLKDITTEHKNYEDYIIEEIFDDERDSRWYTMAIKY